MKNWRETLPYAVEIPERQMAPAVKWCFTNLGCPGQNFMMNEEDGEYVFHFNDLERAVWFRLKFSK